MLDDPAVRKHLDVGLIIAKHASRSASAAGERLQMVSR